MKEYRILKREQTEKKGKLNEKDDEETTPVVAAHDGIFVLCDDDHVNIICYDSDWVVNLSASYHVISHRHFFSAYTEGDFVILGWEMTSHAKLLAWETYIWTQILVPVDLKKYATCYPTLSCVNEKFGG